jgi:hypothetical protein
VDERPVRTAQYVRAKKTIYQQVGGRQGVSSGIVGPIQEGAILPFDHPLHRANPKDFELIKD